MNKIHISLISIIALVATASHLFFQTPKKEISLLSPNEIFGEINGKVIAFAIDRTEEMEAIINTP